MAKSDTCSQPHARESPAPSPNAPIYVTEALDAGSAAESQRGTASAALIPPPPPPAPLAVAEIAAGFRPSDTLAEGGTVCPPSIPGYVLGERLGQGGMGVVFKALQQRPQRLVALKLMRVTTPIRAEEVVRFRREAEAAARLQHPNLVHIYEVGEYAGVPYFSMELVEGGSLAARLAGGPLPPTEAARLAGLLAEAVAHAHQRGILHRDLKPANVLLVSGSLVAGGPVAETGQNTATHQPPATSHQPPVPKITDFGLAKAFATGADSEDTLGLTQTGMLLGTPSYMAPEQAEGQAGPAADIWGLGATLYEMLTGRPPFAGASALETLEQVRRQDPVAPRRLQPKVPRDLETICQRCLDKDPRRRYESAQALAEDLRRFLAGQPIHARPASSAERAYKWARRRPAVAALLFGALLASAAGLAAVFYHQAELGAANQAIKDQRDEAQRQRERAEANLRSARQAAAELNDDAWKRFEGQPSTVNRELLQKSLAVYVRLLEENSDDPAIRHETARAHVAVGLAYGKLGQQAEAEGALDRALTMLGELVEAHPTESRYRRHLALAHGELAVLLTPSPQRAKAERAARRAIAGLEALVAEAPDERAHAHHLALHHSRLGTLLDADGRHDQAEQAFRAGVRIQQALVERFPGRPEEESLLAAIVNNLAIQLEKRNELAEAEGHYRRALELRKSLPARIAALPTYTVNSAKMHTNLGIVLRKQGRSNDAEAELRRGQELFQELARRAPDVPEYRFELALSSSTLGFTLWKAEKRGPAREAYQQAVAELERLVSKFSQVAEYEDRLAAALNDLALLTYPADVSAARRLLGEAIQHQKRAVELDPQQQPFEKQLRSQEKLLAKWNEPTAR